MVKQRKIYTIYLNVYGKNIINLFSGSISKTVSGCLPGRTLTGGNRLENLCKVLIVEDEYITRQGIRNMMDWKAEGFEIVGEACNGKEALELVGKFHPHIVLTDIVMPVMDGLNLEQNLRVKYPEIQVVVLSSYSDFKYVRNSFQSGAADYILKPTLNPAALLKTMREAAARIPGLAVQERQDRSLTTCVERILSGLSTEETQKQFQGAFRKPCFILAGMDVIRIFNGERAALEKQKKLLYQSLEKNMRGYDFVQLVVDESILLLVINFTQAERKSVFYNLKETIEQIARQEPKTCYVVSREFTSPSRLKDIYRGSFLRNLDRIFFYKGKHFLTEEDFKDSEKSEKFDTAEYAKLLGTLQLEKALDCLDVYVDNAISRHSLGEMELKTLVQNAWYRMISILEDEGLNADDLSYLKRDCLVKIYACPYAEDFKRLFHVMEADFRSLVRKYKIDSQSDIIKNILGYIDKHYNEQLTLSSLAKQFNFSYSYLSSYFRSHSAEGFSEYLNKVRIFHAAELLRKGTSAISDVCGAVGYMDQSYFTRVFKKSVGITPREYRRKYRR